MSETTYDWLAGGGEMGRLIRANDWARSPLGPPSSCPTTSRRRSRRSTSRPKRSGAELRRVDPNAFAKIQKLITQTNRQVTRLTQVVDDMLDVSRMETGKLNS